MTIGAAGRSQSARTIADSSSLGPALDGGQILDETGFRPAEDQVLIRLLFPGPRSVGRAQKRDAT